MLPSVIGTVIAWAWGASKAHLGILDIDQNGTSSSIDGEIIGFGAAASNLLASTLFTNRKMAVIES
jgi:hypothetical protein